MQKKVESGISEPDSSEDSEIRSRKRDAKETKEKGKWTVLLRKEMN